MDMSEIEPRSQVSRSGMKGVGAVAGGAGLLVLAGISAIPLIGIIGGAVIAVVGLALMTSRSDRTAGIVTAVAGAATLLGALIPGLRLLIWLPGVGLLGVGIYSLVRFFRGVKSRS
jgi:hypothetical protein